MHWYRKSQATVEAITFVAELCAMKAGVVMVEALRYKLKMFGLPIDGSANVFCGFIPYNFYWLRVNNIKIFGPRGTKYHWVHPLQFSLLAASKSSQDSRMRGK